MLERGKDTHRERGKMRKENIMKKNERLRRCVSEFRERGRYRK